MLTQKATKGKAVSISTMKNAEKIMDKKTKRKYKKMFKGTVRRRQRLLEKREARLIIDEYNLEREGDNHDEYTEHQTSI